MMNGPPIFPNALASLHREVKVSMLVGTQRQELISDRNVFHGLRKVAGRASVYDLEGSSGK